MRLFVLALCVMGSQANAFCFSQAAQRYGVDEQLLIAIAKTESNFDPKARHVNKDKSVDIGLMQINSSLWPALSEYGITEESLLDACTSVHVGAWVLAQSIRYFGHTWRAVGGYGAGLVAKKEGARHGYAQKVAAALAQQKKTPYANTATVRTKTNPGVRAAE